MIWPDAGRHQEERKELARNLKAKIVGRNKRLEPPRPSTYMK
jgi:hypothetical protein